MKVEIFPIQKHHTGRILFYLNLTVEEVPNYKLLLGHSHFDYVESLLNHTSSTAKLGEKGTAPYYAMACHFNKNVRFANFIENLFLYQV